MKTKTIVFLRNETAKKNTLENSFAQLLAVFNYCERFSIEIAGIYVRSGKKMFDQSQWTEILNRVGDCKTINALSQITVNGNSVTEAFRKVENGKIEGIVLNELNENTGNELITNLYGRPKKK